MKRCAICSHKKRAEIEAAIIAGVSSYSTISRQYGVKVDCLKDHKRLGHLKVASLVAAQEEEEKHGIDVAALLDEILEISLGSAREAREAKAFSSIGSIMAAALKVAEILSRDAPGHEESGLDGMRKEMKARRDDRKG